MKFKLDIYTCPKTGKEFITSPPMPIWPIVILLLASFSASTWISFIMYFSLNLAKVIQ